MLWRRMLTLCFLCSHKLPIKLMAYKQIKNLIKLHLVSHIFIFTKNLIAKLHVVRCLVTHTKAQEFFTFKFRTRHALNWLRDVLQCKQVSKIKGSKADKYHGQNIIGKLSRIIVLFRIIIVKNILHIWHF